MSLGPIVPVVAIAVATSFGVPALMTGLACVGLFPAFQIVIPLVNRVYRIGRRSIAADSANVVEMVVTTAPSGAYVVARVPLNLKKRTSRRTKVEATIADRPMGPMLSFNSASGGRISPTIKGIYEYIAPQAA